MYYVELEAVGSRGSTQPFSTQNTHILYIKRILNCFDTKLYNVQPVHCTMHKLYNLQPVQFATCTYTSCTIYNLYIYILYNLQAVRFSTCTLCTLYNVPTTCAHSTLYNVSTSNTRCTLYTAHLSRVHCTMYTVHPLLKGWQYLIASPFMADKDTCLIMLVMLASCKLYIGIPYPDQLQYPACWIFMQHMRTAGNYDSTNIYIYINKYTYIYIHTI